MLNNESPKEKIHSMISSVISTMVDKPDSVKISSMENPQDNSMLFGLTVDKTDLGKVIGKSGRNANALRILVNAVASKYGVRALLDIHNGQPGVKST